MSRNLRRKQSAEPSNRLDSYLNRASHSTAAIR